MCWEGYFFLPCFGFLTAVAHETRFEHTPHIPVYYYGNKSSTLVLCDQVRIATIGNNGWHQRKMYLMTCRESPIVASKKKDGDPGI